MLRWGYLLCLEESHMKRLLPVTIITLVLMVIGTSIAIAAGIQDASKVIAESSKSGDRSQEAGSQFRIADLETRIQNPESRMQERVNNGMMEWWEDYSS